MKEYLETVEDEKGDAINRNKRENVLIHCIKIWKPFFTDSE